MSRLMQLAGPQTLAKPAPIHKIPDKQMLLEMPCGEYCSAQCAPTCTSGKFFLSFLTPFTSILSKMFQTG